jgi:hypothetical protein
MVNKLLRIRKNLISVLGNIALGLVELMLRTNLNIMPGEVRVSIGGSSTQTAAAPNYRYPILGTYSQ